MNNLAIMVLFLTTIYTATSSAQTAGPTTTPPAAAKEYSCQFMCKNLNSMSTTKVPTTPSQLAITQKPEFNFSCEFNLTTDVSSCDSDSNPTVKSAVEMARNNCKAMNVTDAEDNIKPLFLYCLEKTE